MMLISLNAEIEPAFAARPSFVPPARITSRTKSIGDAAYAAYSGQNVDGMSGATEQATTAKEEKCDTEAAKTCGGDCEHDHK